MMETPTGPVMIPVASLAPGFLGGTPGGASGRSGFGQVNDRVNVPKELAWNGKRNGENQEMSTREWEQRLEDWIAEYTDPTNLAVKVMNKLRGDLWKSVRRKGTEAL